MDFLHTIAHQFSDRVTEIAPLGNGLVNDTYLVETGSSRFVLQRINRRVFPDPERIMANLAALSRYLDENPDKPIGLCIPDMIKTRSGGSHFIDRHNDIWRALSFIHETLSLETLRGLDDAYETGSALGRFHRLLSGLDPVLLHDTLPGFHITPDYLSRYHQISANSSIRPKTAESRYCADFITAHESIADDLESAKRQGLLRLRVIHGDPKLNNFLFDNQSGKVVSLIDLDTVKPGLLHYDIGDCLRSCCLSTETGEFDTEIAEAILEGYLTETSDFFTEQDDFYLYPAIRLLPFELGLRFYTDHLEGDRYFKVAEPGQNLQRAVEQFRLCASIIAQEQEIRHLLDKSRPTSRT